MKLIAIVTLWLMAFALAIEVIATPANSSSLNRLTGPFDGLPFLMETQEYNNPAKEYSLEEMETWFNATMAEHNNSALAKRGKGRIYCIPETIPFDWNWRWAYLPSVQTVIRHLMDGGPQRCHWKARWCRRAACLNAAEIVVCNYNWYDIDTNCDYIATYAIDMITMCRTGIDIFNPQKSYVGGYEEDTPDNFNVWLRGANCET
ncbi:hypothetical protein BKA65DRAFT_475339 [Rhexocercosporidium sp. MPI-PUGE-AT-0058]|nr:hypothetical protein BKA65DRAFT_475339 [Rhexocercosporidium sp. MPI-PUGE-AT-0058]